MSTKVPTWVDERDITEREHFLRFPVEMQEKYRQTFWKIRLTVLKGLFYERLEVANQAFREGIPGWKTDRGRIYMLAGAPDMVRSYAVGEDKQITPEVQTVVPQTANTYLIWTYLWGSRQTNYVFKYVSGDWKDSYDTVALVSNQSGFERELRKIWAPQDWSVWAAILLDWVHEKEEKK